MQKEVETLARQMHNDFLVFAKRRKYYTGNTGLDFDELGKNAQDALRYVARKILKRQAECTAR